MIGPEQMMGEGDYEEHYGAMKEGCNITSGSYYVHFWPFVKTLQLQVSNTFTSSMETDVR